MPKPLDEAKEGQDEEPGKDSDQGRHDEEEHASFVSSST